MQLRSCEVSQLALEREGVNCGYRSGEAEKVGLMSPAMDTDTRAILISSLYSV
jgi:hypothetical protein